MRDAADEGFQAQEECADWIEWDPASIQQHDNLRLLLWDRIVPTLFGLLADRIPCEPAKPAVFSMGDARR